MNFRTKAFGLVSALALAATMTAGMASAQTVTTGVELSPDGTTPGGTCTFAVTAGSNIDFGSLTWDGDSYAGATTPGTITGSLDHNGTPTNRPCELQVQSSALSFAGIDAFQAADITFDATSVTGPGFAGKSFALATSNTDVFAPGTIQVPLGSPFTGSTSLTLNDSAVNNAAPVGVYTGTLIFTVSNGA